MKIRLSCLCLIAAFLVTPALADDDEPLSAGPGNVANAQLQKELAVLQSNPDEASEACVSALKELHKTQAQVDAEQQRTHDQDLAVAQDVLESDFENAIEMCGPDARRMCGTQNPSAKLAHACETLGSIPE